MAQRTTRGKDYPPAPMLDEVKKRLRRLGRSAKKGLGQHFLVDGAVLNEVVAAAELSPADTVLEIGPGLGVLTRALAERVGRVVAVELDENLAAALENEMASSGNVTIVNGDILKLNPASLVDGPAYKVVANLPYYITAAALRHLLEATPAPRLMVLMIQKEVAQAIAAADKLSLLAVSVWFYGAPRIVSYVRADSFYPPPQVDSAILKIDVYQRPAVDVADREGFFRLVRAGFSTRRKQLAGSLANGLGLEKAATIDMLSAAEISPRRRAETLSLEEWARLWGVFRQGKTSC